MRNIHQKNYLADNLNKMKNVYPDEYNFFPATWILPDDRRALLDHMKTVKNEKGSNNNLIAKPFSSCQGKGIFLITKASDIPADGYYVVQEYIEKYYLN